MDQPRHPIAVQREQSDVPVDVASVARQLAATLLALDHAVPVLPIRRAS